MAVLNRNPEVRLRLVRESVNDRARRRVHSPHQVPATHSPLSPNTTGEAQGSSRGWSQESFTSGAEDPDTAGSSLNVFFHGSLYAESAVTTLRLQRRIGVELHDRIGPILIGASLLARSLQERLGTQRSAEARAAADIVEQLGQCYQQIRNLAKGLTSGGVDLGEALLNLAARTQTVHGIPTEYVGPEDVTMHSPEVNDHLYQIAQEAVSNAVRHGQPHRVVISLGRDLEHLDLSIQDDGAGISQRPPTCGVGIWSMRYRAEAIGARLDIRPRPEGGTVVRCLLPLSRSH